MKPVSVPDAPSLLSTLAFSGAAPVPLDVAIALALERDTEESEAGSVVGEGVDV